MNASMILNEICDKVQDAHEANAPPSTIKVGVNKPAANMIAEQFDLPVPLASKPFFIWMGVLIHIVKSDDPEPHAWISWETPDVHIFGHYHSHSDDIAKSLLDGFDDPTDPILPQFDT